jgi:hypothetical protein
MSIRKFKDFEPIKEAQIALSEISDDTYSNLRLKGIVPTDEVNQNLLDDLAKAAETAGVKCFITCAKSDHPSTETGKGRHPLGMAVDISRVGYGTTDWGKIYSTRGPQSPNQKVEEFIDAGTKLVMELINLGYKLVTDDQRIIDSIEDKSILVSSESSPKCIIWRTFKGGNHYNHVHVSNKTGGISSYVPKVVGKIKSFFGFGEEEEQPVQKEVEKEKQSTSTILTSLSSSKELPVLIIHPTKEIEEKLGDELTTLFSSLIQKFVVVYPKKSDVTSEELIKDIETYLRDKDSEMVSLSVMFFGKSCASKNLIDYSQMDKVKNILLINPPPSKTVQKFIQTSKLKPFIAIDVETVKKLYGDKEVESMISSYKEKIIELGLVVDGYLKTLTPGKLEDLIKSVITTFEPRMLKRLEEKQ